MFNMGKGSALLVQRDPPPSFLNGQEKVGMILLISLAAVSVTALAIVLIYHRRNINRQPQAAQTLTRQLHSKEVELTGSRSFMTFTLITRRPVSLVVGPPYRNRTNGFPTLHRLPSSANLGADRYASVPKPHAYFP
ncbi:hypothetical protein BC629DRAFT_1441024 [Irpex lacteus]|nr:hypothetical protein BC629DRAFT_1441024 [Irpex lacteus]